MLPAQKRSETPARAGMPYSRADFLSHYTDAAEWDAAEPERRIDADGRAYTRVEFDDQYEGGAEWDAAATAARDPAWYKRTHELP